MYFDFNRLSIMTEGYTSSDIKGNEWVGVGGGGEVDRGQKWSLLERLGITFLIFNVLLNYNVDYTIFP